MKTENLDKIKKLNGCAKALSTYWQEWKDKYVSDSSCDKRGASFSSNDNRFTVFATNVLFSAHKGYYGNSGCSTFSNGIDADIAKQYFAQALDRNKEKVFADMAELMKLDAAKLTAEAEKEIAALNSMIEEVRAA